VLDEDAVLDATVTSVAANGSATSMQDISERCGIAKTTLVDRFGGKERLIGAAVDRERRRLADHLVSAYEPNRDATAKVQVERGFEAFFSYARDHHDAFVVLFGTGSASGSDTARADVSASIAEIMSSRFAALGAEIDTAAKVIAAVITAAGEAVARIVVADELDGDVLARFVADLIVNGLEGLDVGGLFEANAAKRPRRTVRSKS
jgi:AcrR family transcriptional regulator